MFCAASNFELEVPTARAGELQASQVNRSVELSLGHNQSRLVFFDKILSDALTSLL